MELYIFSVGEIRSKLLYFNPYRQKNWVLETIQFYFVLQLYLKHSIKRKKVFHQDIVEGLIHFTYIAISYIFPGFHTNWKGKNYEK